MARELSDTLNRLLNRLPPGRRRLLAACLLATLAAIALGFLLDVMPRRAVLRIAGSEVVSNRQFLTRMLQEEAARHGLTLRIQPALDAEQTLEQLDRHQIDLAFVQAGAPGRYRHVTQLAAIPPELVHLLTRPGIDQLAELKGRRIDLGERGKQWSDNARQLLAFAGLRADRDYLESNLPQEELMTLPAEQLPDAVATASYLPSMLADFLVRQRGYRMIDLPFPATPSSRLSWAAAAEIPAFLYGAAPAVPPRPLRTAGVNLHLLANDEVDAKAEYQLLQALYSPAMAVRMKIKFDEAQLTLPSGFPLARGAQAFLERDSPLISRENFEKAKSLGGLLASLMSALLLARRWFRGEKVELD
ncbi:hypothetical protein CXB49_04580 [Chromobacterium sp. ATCC 53434]|uniref:TAXI family TRAP transporter solute-binding subunit n=1 Tax=Chromobacterium sp. (strain ATCC 53434 / SC 14030) TaxID=2059672 RepID=UPI000C759A48|nr:TAXI family TRAP transporter solute-binding subunit [Chromobacterium sp. ATCC 53434]AUH50146.1 hypothetical protein CXB49_04580 [Chromobacterium sp. ATCC 53434]